MRVLVCGSRDFGDPRSARAMLSNRIAELPDDAVVLHGKARGIDIWADALAWERGLDVEGWAADWATHGKAAGILRSNAMLDSKPDLVLAFWNGFSKGTLHTITEARKRGIPTEVIPLEPL